MSVALCCPFCRTSLEDLRCESCGRSFGRSPEGIPLLLHEDLPAAREKLREVRGWVEKARAEEWYEPDDEVDRSLPFPHRHVQAYVDELSWLASGHSFQVLLERYVGDARGLRALELGAAKAWAAPYWRERDCEYVATDILVDPNIGLGRGSFYGDFARVQADGEYLPFADASFDVTYCVAALHHAVDLPRMVGEMARVTRRGGVVAGLNEGTRPLFHSPDNPEQAAEKALGINEHVHTVWTYARVFRRAGVSVRRVERADGWPPKPFTLLARVPKLGATLAAMLHLSFGGYAGVSIYGRRR